MREPENVGNPIVGIRYQIRTGWVSQNFGILQYVEILSSRPDIIRFSHTSNTVLQIFHIFLQCSVMYDMCTFKFMHKCMSLYSVTLRTIKYMHCQSYVLEYYRIGGCLVQIEYFSQFLFAGYLICIVCDLESKIQNKKELNFFNQYNE